MNAVWPQVSVARADDDREGARHTTFFCVHAFCKRQQCRRCRINLPLPELHFECRPLAAARFHDGIDFKACVIAIVQYFAIHRLRVHSQVTHDERFEEEAEKIQVGQQCVRRRAKRG